jgi:transcription elongation factor Elf1
MGRKARARADKKEAGRQHGIAPPEEAELERPSKCPRCGSTNLVVGPYMAGITQGVDIVCGNCNWHGMLQPGIW